MIHRIAKKHQRNHPQLKKVFNTDELVEVLIDGVENNKNQYEPNKIVNHYNIIFNQPQS